MSGAEAKALLASAGARPTAYLLDPNGVVGKAYEAKTTPHMYIVNKAGKLVYAGGIDDKPTANPADIAGAPQPRAGRARRAEGGESRLRDDEPSLWLLGQIFGQLRLGLPELVSCFRHSRARGNPASSLGSAQSRSGMPAFAGMTRLRELRNQHSGSP